MCSATYVCSQPGRRGSAVDGWMSVFTVIAAEEAAAVCKCQVNYDVMRSCLIVGKTSGDKKICIMFSLFLGLNLSSGFILVSCNLSS